MRARHRFALLIAAATWGLLLAGALVTSTDSGLSVPDWPLSYGTLFPPMVGGIRFEHTHRMIAGTVGLLTLALAVWLGVRETRRGVRRLGWIALGAVVAQALLGGITVLYQLPVPVSVSHACLGQLFFCLAVTLAVMTSPRWLTAAPITTPTPSTLPWWGALATATVFIQLVLGAIMRHTGHGLSWHVAWALITGITVIGTAWLALRHYRAIPELRWTAAAWLAAVVAQIALGIVTAWVHPSVATRSAHVVTGAVVLALSVMLTLWAFRRCATRAFPPLGAYLELTKPRLTTLALITTAVGFVLGTGGAMDYRLLLHALLGTALVGGGAAALNQYWEWEADGRMQRTRHRPIPSGRLQPARAFYFGVTLAVLGLAELSWHVGALASWLGAATLISYLGCYTPLKTRSSLCTLVGAVPGALPPLIGWAAATGRLDVTAWTLFAILFLWQLPHFLAIGWLYRDDYAAAGFRMLSVGDADGRATGRQMVLYCMALIPAALAPTLLGLTGALYFFGALGLSIALCVCGVLAARWTSAVMARRAFLASIAYLPALLTLMTYDRVLPMRMLVP